MYKHIHQVAGGLPNMMERVAAAPISWGICEVPGWGFQLPPDRVLGEMQSAGITATELGALGWLPTDAAALTALLRSYDLSLIGGFVPLVLHDASQRDALIADTRRSATTLSAGGGTCFVTAVVSSHERWERPALDAHDWTTLFDHLELVDDICDEFDLTQVMHPHVDTLIETASEMDRFLSSCPTQFTLDTGHLYIGGADPVVLASKHHDRVGLVHIKDIDGAVAARLLDGELTLMTATQAGLFPSAGDGEVPIAATIAALEGALYGGWYVLEQDVALTDEIPPVGEGPVLGVLRSIEYLRSLAV
jgi:inosose dehydratase